MSMIQSEYATLPRWTSTTMGATGATNLVAAPGAGISIHVFEARYVNFTNTAGFADLRLVEGNTTTASRLRSLSNSIGAVPLDNIKNTAFTLDTNASLDAVLSVTAASTPSILIEVGFQLITRRPDNEMRAGL